MSPPSALHHETHEVHDYYFRRRPMGPGTRAYTAMWGDMALGVIHTAPRRFRANGWTAWWVDESRWEDDGFRNVVPTVEGFISRRWAYEWLLYERGIWKRQ